MRWGTRTCSRQSLLWGAHVVCLFAVVYLYVLLRIQPHLLYHTHSNMFFVDTDFFFTFLDRPGGVVEYVTAFLSALLRYDWLGALVFAVLAGMLCLMTHHLLFAIAGEDGRAISLVPALLILMLLGQYVHTIRLCVGLLVVLVSASVYIRTSSCSDTFRLVAFLTLSALVYYLAAGLYVVFASLCAVFELGVKRYLPLGIVVLLCVAMVPMGGAWFFELRLGQSWNGIMFNFRHWLATPQLIWLAWMIWIGLLLFFPVAAAAAVLRRRRRADSAVVKDGEGDDSDTVGNAGDSCSLETLMRPVVLTVAFLACLLGADKALFDSSTQCLLQAACYADDQKWADVIGAMERLPATHPAWQDIRTVFEVNRALYYQGELLDRLFAYPQNPADLTLEGENIMQMARMSPRQCSQIFFELGRVNESELMSHESLEIFGARPNTVKRLVYINVIKGRLKAAERFLAFMEPSMFYGQWARQCRRQLASDPELSEVPAVAACRKLMVTHDSINAAQHGERLLAELVSAEPRNRMAFEYLMAYYFMTRQLDKLVTNLHRFDELGYSRLPRHYEEALVMYVAIKGPKSIDLGKWTISSETRYRKDKFVEALKQFSHRNPDEAYAELYGEFGDTYLFYHLFGRNSLPAK